MLQRENDCPWYIPDARGWIGLGIFGLTVLLIMLMRDRQLREDEFFQTIATVIISNGLMGVVSWAYAATKGGGELADKNAAIVAESATATVAKATTNGETQKVEVVNTEADPVNTTTNDEALPDYAKP